MQQKKMERPHIGRCIRVAGSPTAGVVLYRLIFWKPTRQIGGRWWFAKSYTELAFETGLSKRQIEDAVSKLRKDGLIQTTQHLFHGKNVMHVLVTGEARNRLNEEHGVPVNPGTQVPVNPGTQVPAESGTPYTSYMQGESQGESQGYSVHSHAGALGDQAEESGEGKTMPPKKPRHTSVKEAILNATVSPKAGGKLHKPNSVKALEMTWTKTLADVSGGFVPPLTMKELGQLKLFRGKCPPGKAEDVLTWALNNWIEFVKNVEASAGLKKSPGAPSIDFLLKHAAVAVNLMVESQQPKAMQEAKVVGIPVAKPVQLISHPEPKEEAPQTLDELLSIINGEEDAG